LLTFVSFVAALKIRFFFSYAFVIATAIGVAFLVAVFFGYSYAAEIANSNSIDFSHFKTTSYSIEVVCLNKDNGRIERAGKESNEWQFETKKGLKKIKLN
jgi:hypothetical protein